MIVAIADALGKIGDSAAEQALLAVHEDPLLSGLVEAHVAAVRALAKVGTLTCIEPLMAVERRSNCHRSYPATSRRRRYGR